MKKIQGVLSMLEVKGPNIIGINQQPAVQYFTEYQDEIVKLIIRIKEADSSKKEFNGTADVFYYEGKDFYGGAKIANDFYIDDHDVLAFLEDHIGKEIEMEITFQ